MVFQHQCQKNPCMSMMTVTAAVPQHLHQVPHPLQKGLALKIQDALQNESQWMFACRTRVQHIMIPCSDSSQPSVNGVHYRAACGVRLPLECKFQELADPQLARCRHSGCRIRWDFQSVDYKNKNCLRQHSNNLSFKCSNFQRHLRFFICLLLKAVTDNFSHKEARLATFIA